MKQYDQHEYRRREREWIWTTYLKGMGLKYCDSKRRLCDQHYLIWRDRDHFLKLQRHRAVPDTFPDPNQ
jgi:hypothetical protein